MLGLIERIGGSGFLDDLSEFLSAVSGIADGFLDRALRVEKILLGESTRFILIGGARSGTEPGTLEFLDELETLDAKLAAIVLNRVPPWPLAESAEAWLTRADGQGMRDDVRRLEEIFGAADADKSRDQAEAISRILRESAIARSDANQSRSLLAARAASSAIECHLLDERPVEIDRLPSLFSLTEPLLKETSA